MSDDLIDFLDSKSLIGFQLDASHLHNVLHTVLRNQQASAQSVVSLNKRMQSIETAVQELSQRYNSLEAAIGRISAGNDDVRALKVHLQDVSAVVDNISRHAVPELRRGFDDTRRVLQPLERSVQQLSQALGPLDAALQQQQLQLEDLLKETQQSLRQVQSQIGSVQVATEERAREQQSELGRVTEVLREIQLRSDRLERSIGPNATQWKEYFEELNTRSDENFRQVELSAKAVDGELHRLRTDIANLRTEVNALDNNGRQKMAKVTEDMDSKFDMVLNLLQNYERSSSELEEHLAAAGRALAHSRAQPMSGPRSSTVTTTTSALRGGGFTTDVRRNVLGELSDPRRGGSIN